MRNMIIILTILVLSTGCGGKAPEPASQDDFEDQTARVMVLGTFHFHYPNQDAFVTEEQKQIDILSEKRQQELKQVIDRLLRFHPDKIAVEIRTEKQAEIDSQYRLYRSDNYELKINEVEQIAFRMAKTLGHEKIYCIDTWGDYERFMEKNEFWEGYEDYLKNGPDAASQERYTRFYEDNDQYLLDHSLLDYFIKTNESAHLIKLQGAYFLNGFSYESVPYDYSGVDWEASRWYDRNLRIFRNIKRITEPGDKIFVLFGAGHHALLKDYIEYSPLHTYISPLNLLKE